MNEQAAEEWLTVSQAAARLKCSDKSIRRKIERGELEAHKVKTATGQEWRIKFGTVPDVQELDRPGLDRETDTDGQVTDSKSGETDTLPDTPGQTDGHSDGHLPALVEHLQGEVEFLRARNAELNAVVMQQARALESAQHRAALVEATAAPQSAPGVPVEEKDGSSAKGAQRGATGFWMRARRLARELLR